MYLGATQDGTWGRWGRRWRWGCRAWPLGPECLFLSCDLGRLLGGYEGPMGSGSEVIRHSWCWGGRLG